MTINFCECGASLASGARFCGECGKPNKALARAQWQEMRADNARRSRAFSVVGMVYGAVLAMLFLIDADADPRWAMTGFFFGQLVVGVAGGLVLGPITLKHALGRVPGARDLGLAGLTAMASLVIAYAWVGMIDALVSADSDAVREVMFEFPASLLFIAVMPALSEEWLCRGVLWQAVRPVVDRNSAIIATAVPFAFLHLLGGGLALELPHRFAMGLILGWLRARTGSLWPCVLAHFLHNGIVVILE